MIAASDLRRGWCPSALTPMETGDGWLVRVKPRCGRYSLDQARAIASASQIFGNGQIDLTNRANLQIRGIALANIAAVQSALSDVGLVDATAATDAIRNVIVDPLAGSTDASAQADRLAAELEAALVSDPALTALPGKFGFAIDCGYQSELAQTAADIVLRPHGERVAIVCAGASDRAIEVPRASAVSAAIAIAHAFVGYARNSPDIRRMADLVTDMGAEKVFAAAALQDEQRVTISRSANSLGVGVIRSNSDDVAVAFGLPFGRTTAAALKHVIEACTAAYVTDIRPALGRLLVVPCPSGRYDPLRAAAMTAGWVVSASDQRLRIDACPGAPACDRGSTDTRTDAAALAAWMTATSLSPTVHVSGCEKGCARRQSADLTFVARHGQYDLVIEGSAKSIPTVTGLAASQLVSAAAHALGGPHG